MNQRLDKHIFRENDIRGVYGAGLSDDAVCRIGLAFSSLLLKRRIKSVIIGMDIRLSSPRIKEVLVKAFNSRGVAVIDIGLCPTPVFYFAAHFESCRSGIMITGSHNPPEYNGMKIVLEGKTLFSGGIYRLGARAEKESSLSGNKNSTEKVIRRDYTKKYTAYVVKNIGKVKKKVKAAVDCGNGTGFVALELFRRMGVSVTGLFEKPDGNFPNHFPDPTIPENLSSLKKTVTCGKMDLGFAFDGDSDRLGVVDDTGNMISGDSLLLYFAEKVINAEKGKRTCRIIYEVKCTELLKELIPEWGGIPIMWKTGHSLIEDKMEKEKAVLAGEMSGHIYFKDRYFGFDDAIYSAARLLKYFSEEKIPFSGIMKKFLVYKNTPEIRIDCPDSKKASVIEKIKKKFRRKGHRVIDIDGARIYFKNGWGLVRASNTQPVIVMRCEAKTGLELIKIKKLLTSELKKGMQEVK